MSRLGVRKADIGFASSFIVFSLSVDDNRVDKTKTYTTQDSTDEAMMFVSG